MVMHQVKSSNILQIGYDPKIKILLVKFKNDVMYEYSEVPSGIYKNFIGAPSLGKYFALQIKGKFPYKVATEIK